MRYVVLTIMDNQASVFQIVAKIWPHMQQGISLRIPLLGIQTQTFERRTKVSDFHNNAIFFEHAAVRCQRESSHGPQTPCQLFGRKLRIKRRQLVATSPTPLFGGKTRLSGDIAYFAACVEVSKGTLLVKFRSNEM